MALETINYITDLVISNPAGSDQKLDGDNHIRGMKRVWTNTFTGFVGSTATPKAVTLSEDQLNDAALKSEAATITGAWQIDAVMTWGVEPNLEHDVPLSGLSGGGSAVELIQCGGSDTLIIGEPSGVTLAGNLYYAGTGFHQFYTGAEEIVRMGARNAGTMLIKDRDNTSLKTVGYRCPTREVESGATYTLSQNDEGRVKVFTGSSAVVTCPRNLDDDELGFTCTLMNKSGGDITVVPTAPATMELLLGGSVDTGGFTLADNSVVQVYNGATDVWEAWGNGAS